nr:hypothetical protein BaRGS_006380 [Batillaria attramentaria]
MMMEMRMILCLILAGQFLVMVQFTSAREFETLKHLKSKSSAETQAATVTGMVKRVIGDRANEFVIRVNPSLSTTGKDTYQLQTVDQKMQVTGSTGIAAAMGVYYYLKYYCDSQYTWAGKNIRLPATLPVIATPITMTAQDKFRYYQNVCTVSYSMAFWDWAEWERHLDWMAMNGINLPLAFTGQEAIFQRLYMSMGFTSKDMDGFFGGPAFLAWARMGNIQGWGGPLPQMWITNQLLLQHQVLQRMRDFGMVPVLPAFAGHVPARFQTLFPQSKVSRLGGWARFNATYSYTYLLDFEDPMFETIGAKFIKLMEYEFGVDHIYNADTFNEMTPKSNDTEYLASAGKAVYNAMQKGDPDAIWLMQGWLFLNQGFWKPPQIKALLTSVPQGRMIVLDLIAELNPVFTRTESYYGQPFIWCMLHNFGGTMELYGAIDNINVGPSKGRAFPNSTMIGTGLTPEGIFQNEVIYEFMNENAWRSGPRDIDSWLHGYAKQRYGVSSPTIDKAWQLLKLSVYNCTDAHHDNDRVIITRRPNIKSNVHKDMWYDPEMLFQAWDLFITAAAEMDAPPTELFIYDLVDVTRNCLQVLSQSYYLDIMLAYNNSDLAALSTAGQKMVELLLDMDKLLASDRHFLLGNWLQDAVAWATDMAERWLLIYNARNQITLWGPDGEIVDYASKQWAGVFKDYYAPRWKFFADWLGDLIKNKTKFDNYIFKEHIMAEVEQPFNLVFDTYTRNTTDNTC